MSEKVYKLQEVAERWRCHAVTLRRLAEEGKIPAFRVGHQWRMRKDDILEYERKNGASLKEQK